MDGWDGASGSWDSDSDTWSAVPVEIWDTAIGSWDSDFAIWDEGEIEPPLSGQRDSDPITAFKRKGRIYTIIVQAAKTIAERPGPLRKKRRKLAKIIAEEVQEAVGGLLNVDERALEETIRRGLKSIPLTELHTQGWSELQDALMQVITDAEQTAQRLRAESEEEDELLLLLAS